MVIQLLIRKQVYKGTFHLEERENIDNTTGRVQPNFSKTKNIPNTHTHTHTHTHSHTPSHTYTYYLT